MGITNWSIRHSITIFVFMLCLVLAGMGAYRALPREASPDITIPYVMITTPYVGVSPSDIETLVTNPLEEELEKLKDVEQIRSTSSEGVSLITIEFKAGVDMSTALSNVRERVDLARPELPNDAEDPIITEISFSEFPILTIALSGDVSLLQLKRIAEQLEDDIERIRGVLDVRVVGGLEREIRIEADPELLDFYNVSFDELATAVQVENLNIPGGTIDVGDLTYLVRVPGEFERIRDIENIVVRHDEGHVIYVRDVAEVVDGFEDQSTYSRLGGQSAVSIVVTRRAGENIIRITDELKALVDDYRAEYGATITFAVLNDVSNEIRTQLEELENNILTGLLLVLGVLLFFLSGWKRALAMIGGATVFVIAATLLLRLAGLAVSPWVFVVIAIYAGFLFDRSGGLRTALFVGMAIPFSMLISFAVLAAIGVTLNIVVLFSLVLALGMLVDNAIVIVENIYRHMTMGKTRRQASMDGVAEVAWPVIASTATTVGAFIPMMFWPGIMGEFMGFLPLTVIIVLSASLFVALVINPVLCATFMRVDPEAVARTRESNSEHSELDALPDNFVYRAYRSTLELVARSKVTIFGTVTLAFAALIGTFMLFGAYSAGVEFFPETTPERIIVDISLPDGSNVDASDRVVSRVEAFLAGNDMIETLVANIGSGNGGDMMGSGGSGGTAHQSEITIEFVDRTLQRQTPDAFITELRVFLDTLVGVETEIRREQAGPPTGAPINLELIGADYAVLQDIARRAEEILSDVPGIVDLSSDLESGRQELAIRVDREQAGLLGISTRTIANTVRSAINGVEASVFREDNEEYDIVVRLAERYRSSLEDVERLWIKTPDGDRVQLREVAELGVQDGYGAIRHLDSSRVVTLSGDVAEGRNQNEVLARAQIAIAEHLELPAGYVADWTGQYKDQMEAESFLGGALLAALFIIVLILITQFNSLVQSFIIMFSVVLSLIGVLLILLVRGLPFSVIMTGVGVISLAGVVVNNAIVLIDYINQLRERGLAAKEAVVTACLVRFRPVLLTAITTALSLLPTVLGVSLDAKRFRLVTGGTSVEFWGPMANAVVGGLVVATILTLVVVPGMYLAAEITTTFFRKNLGFLFPDDDEAPGAPGANAPDAGPLHPTTAPLRPVNAMTADSELTLASDELPEPGGSRA